MRYLLSVVDNESTSASPAEHDGDPVGAFNSRLKANGHWVFAGGLASPSAATVIDNRRDEVVFTDGPYLESKEYLGGLWILEAPDLGTARELAVEASKHCDRRIELRPFRDE
ncbi:YciI family protein [Kribbella sp. NPDC051952]|uniref:YciI family protein n=1 Tax=Kribbella sp. NPDC051952 TaxID=3154851 RepID=UPI00342BF8B6